MQNKSHFWLYSIVYSLTCIGGTFSRGWGGVKSAMLNGVALIFKLGQGQLLKNLCYIWEKLGKGWLSQDANWKSQKLLSF